MPPSRRRPPPSAGQAPPVRRPRRVAGLPTPGQRSATDREDEPRRESLSGTLDIENAEPPAQPDLASSVDDVAELDEDRPDPDIAEPAPTRRPAGKRRTTGTTRPEDLRAAEAGTTVDRPRRVRVEVDPRRRRGRQLSVAIVLTVVAVVLAGLAFWFRGESEDLGSGDTNAALADSGATSEAVGQLKSAIEQTFSYNYTDLGATEKAVDSTLTGKARCEYDQLFGQVKQLAPKQKIVMVTAVRDIALIRLDGDRAEALVFIDQSSTRVDVNNSVAGEAQFAVMAHHEGDHWKITDFNMFDQPLVNGKPAPKC